MKEKNKFFAQAFDWLYQHGKAIDQTDIAKKTGLSKTTISRILNHGVSHPDEKTIRKLNAAFGNIFNPDFLRGQSEEMFLEKSIPDDSSVNNSLNEPSQIDQSSMVNAIIASHNVAIASKDETIASLERELKKANESSRQELAAKEASHKREVELLEKQLSDKKEQIKSLQEDIKSWKDEAASWKKQAELLRARLAQQQLKDTFGNYPYTPGVAESDTARSTAK